MVLSAFAFSWMTVFVKLAGRRLPWQEIVFARALVTLGLSYLAVRAAGVPTFGKHRKLLVVRGIFGFMGLSSVYYAVTHLPLAEATVLQYMYPPLTVLLASVALREPVDRSVLLSMIISLVGLLLVSRAAGRFVWTGRTERALARRRFVDDRGGSREPARGGSAEQVARNPARLSLRHQKPVVS
jgi:drug/metabolite transporter (DMT)-like permease